MPLSTKYLLLATLLLAGCEAKHKECVELWEINHVEAQPVSYAFANKCCRDGEAHHTCLSKIWQHNQSMGKK